MTCDWKLAWFADDTPLTKEMRAMVGPLNEAEGSGDRYVWVDAALAPLVATLSLTQKVTLLTGADFWTTAAEPAIGLRQLVLSDGPSGVRGRVWDEREPSINFPSSTALAASWDVGLAAEYGEALAVEARRKNVDIVLGPTINLHRSPLGGRHFEAFSEDPLLTAEMAVSYVQGVQRYGIGAVPKHFVANDSEDMRFTVDIRVDERTLREVYMLPFERVVRDGNAWAIMSAYNSVNGTTMTENSLLESPLSTEWGFDGVVISDWTAVRTTEESARARQDLAMPGPHGPWGAELVAAVRAGSVAERLIDDKVIRLLRLALRIGALETMPGPSYPPLPTTDLKQFARRAAAAGMVLLCNDRILPLDMRALKSVAVIGAPAVHGRTQGGGSATVVPRAIVEPVDGLRRALPGVRVTEHPGVATPIQVIPFSPTAMTNPATGASGLRVRFLAADGTELHTEDRFAAALFWLGNVPAGAHSVELSVSVVPDHTGTLRVGVACLGDVTVTVDGETVIDGHLEANEGEFAAGLLTPPSTFTDVQVFASRRVGVHVLNTFGDRDELAGAASIILGTVAAADDDDERIADAAAVAAGADVAVVFVGTTEQDESEGSDRTSLAFPGRQDDLVSAVLAANPRTVVVVNAGAPVLMPWSDKAAAVLLVWFPGQEFGYALADVLLGSAEPGGRLPTTWPAAQGDVPVFSTTPSEGVLTYSEGVHIGYRAWMKARSKPAYAFGHGLGYTTFAMTDVDLPPSVAVGEDVAVRVSVANTGSRAGKVVLQVYLSRPNSTIDRPVMWLASFASVNLDAGATQEVVLVVRSRAFQHWHDGWQTELGSFEVSIGEASDNLQSAGSISVRE